MDNITLTGVFASIDAYKNLLFRLDEQSHEKLVSTTKSFEGKSPINTFLTENNKEIHTLRVKVSQWNSLDVNFKKLFSHLIKKDCILTVELKKYNFQNKDGLNCVGWTASHLKLIQNKETIVR